MSRRRGPASRRGSSGGEGRYAKLAARVEENSEKTLTYFAPPQAPRNNVKSANMLERFNAAINRRARVVRIFPSPAVSSRFARQNLRPASPNEASRLRRARTLAAERRETRRDDARSIDMTLLEDGKRARLTAAACGPLGFAKGIGRHPLSAALARQIGAASDGGSEGIASPDRMRFFAELDARN